MDDDNEVSCPNCDLRFTVIWSNDWEMQQRRQANQHLLEFCPRCGEEMDYAPESEPAP